MYRLHLMSQLGPLKNFQAVYRQYILQGTPTSIANYVSLVHKNDKVWFHADLFSNTQDDYNMVTAHFRAEWWIRG